MAHLQDQVHQASIQNPEKFWMHQAEQLYWHKKPSRALKMSTKTLPSGASHPTWEWFPDGEISTCYNQVDRHVLAGHGNSPAIYYDSPVSNTKRVITYNELLKEVTVLAGVLREAGVQKDDVVLCYMPLVPAAIIGILAANRLGAAHCIVFGGFGAPALAQRIDAVNPKVILTGSCGIDGSKVIPYQPMVHGALEISKCRPAKTIVYQRPQFEWKIDESRGEATWQELTADGLRRGLKTECVPVPSNAPCYISHTSGTTGAPKGVIRDSGGHAVGLHLSISMVFGIHGPGDCIFAASDIGWVLGHAFIMSAPLLTGAATVLYEGKPIGTPDGSAFWRIIEEYKVNTLYCAPTALRAIKGVDPDSNFIHTAGKRGALRSLRGLFLAGERSEPTLITMYQELLDKYAAPGAHVIDNWWSTETGSPITSRALAPHSGVNRKDPLTPSAPPKIKPGSAGKAMPGYNVQIVDDDGNPVKAGEMGNIVLGLPLAPTAFRTLWQDDDRFYRGYLQRFNGKWLDTGDAGYIDNDGYCHIMARNDDVLNVAAHRLSSAAIEQAISSHPDVAECCIVGIPDALKGQVPFAFITLSVAEHPTSAIPNRQIFNEIQQLVRKQVGTIATLGGIVQGKGMIPKTRSGKILRRLLRALVENAAHQDFDADVSNQIPSTIEDYATVEVARQKVREYFEVKKDRFRPIEVRAKL